jgi:hypothetical protein
MQIRAFLAGADEHDALLNDHNMNKNANQADSDKINDQDDDDKVNSPTPVHLDPSIAREKNSDDDDNNNNNNSNPQSTPTPPSSVTPAKMEDFYRKQRQRARLRSPWNCSRVTMLCTALSLLLLATIAQSFLGRQLDPKGCNMSYMLSAFAKYTDFDTEHTRFATKYSLYLYREAGIDQDTRVRTKTLPQTQARLS